ncbi:hypothetical protein MLD38_007551 [Melastoma candidum]|uniref:Uncharacterized protein n=1 Tax=Melastoma candidum TaxID=119954 RepID=A0ACB9RSQ7_9MYRT|nr:hypothetical protein MLD38_007551 [Melastoma candidum]
MGVLDALVDLLEDSLARTRKRHKPMQKVQIKVKMDCDGCERRIRNAVSSMKGVRKVDINRKLSQVTVEGNVEAKKVLEKVKSLGKKKAELWPYVPFNVVPYPYAPQVYDKRAPAGQVRNPTQTLPSPSHERYTSMFSDENPNACTVM